MKVVAALFAAMTFGAAVLLWLEPPTVGWSASTLLAAERAPAIDDVRVDYLSPGAPIDRSYDCVIFPDGQCSWSATASKVRVGVVGSQANGLPRVQAEAVLAVFGSLARRHGLDLNRVWLHPACDARLHPELPPAAHDLCNLLLRKGIIS